MDEVAKQIEELYGARCPDTGLACPVCRAWEAYDTLAKILAEGVEK